MNKVILIGNLTRDPEMSSTQSGIAMCRLGIAVNRNYANSDGVRETDFFNLTAWRNLAERCGKYLHKGTKIAIIGSLQTRSYEVNGEKRYATDIVMDDFEFCSSRNDGTGATFDGGAPEAKGANGTAKVSELEPVDDTDLPF